MRLRFVVTSQREGTNETYQVRVDLVNVTDKPIRLMADWPGGTEQGDYKEYLAADISITTEPAFLPWVGQLKIAEKKNPQPEYTLGAKETLTLNWTASGRRLNRRTIHPFHTHNPLLRMDGLYSVHASVLLRPVTAEPPRKVAAAPAKFNDGSEIDISYFMKASADSGPHGTLLLRSNEQLVPVDGSRQLPKHTLAKLISTDAASNTARIDLGATHKIEVGDQFQILTGYIGAVWNLKITNVDRTSSAGVLEPVGSPGHQPDPTVLVRGALAELISPNDPRHR